MKTGARLLEQAKRDEITVSIVAGMDNGDERLNVVGPEQAMERWVPILREHKQEVLDELFSGPCSRCRASRVRVVPTYWSAWEEALCGPCIQMVVAQFEVSGWPPVPWENELHRKLP